MRAILKLAKPITDIEADFDENSIKAAGYPISRWIPSNYVIAQMSFPESYKEEIK